MISFTLPTLPNYVPGANRQVIGRVFSVLPGWRKTNSLKQTLNSALASKGLICRLELQLPPQSLCPSVYLPLLPRYVLLSPHQLFVSVSVPSLLPTKGLLHTEMDHSWPSYLSLPGRMSPWPPPGQRSTGGPYGQSLPRHPCHMSILAWSQTGQAILSGRDQTWAFCPLVSGPPPLPLLLPTLFLVAPSVMAGTAGIWMQILTLQVGGGICLYTMPLYTAYILPLFVYLTSVLLYQISQTCHPMYLLSFHTA